MTKTNHIPILVYAFGMCAALLLPVAFVGWGGEWRSVRPWQFMVVASSLFILISKRKDFDPEVKLPAGVWRTVFFSGFLGLVLLSLCRYLSFQMGGYNFSIFDLMLYFTNTGAFMYSPICDCDHFTIHTNWIMFLLLPFHRIFESHFFLLLLQPALICASAFALRRIAQRHFKNEILELLVVVTFFHCVWVARVNSYGFHPEVFYIFFGLWLVEFWETKKNLWVWVCILGIWAVKEEAALYTLGFGLAQSIAGDRKQGLVLSVLSFVMLTASLTFLYPMMGGEQGYINYWSHFGDSKLEMIWGIVTSPLLVIKQIFSSQFFIVLGGALFLPLLSVKGFVAMLPGLLLLSLSSKASMQNFSFYHSTVFLPFLFWAICDSGKFKNKKFYFPYAIAAMVLMPLVGGGYHRYYQPQWKIKWTLNRFFSEPLPKDKTLYAQTHLIPHLPYETNVKKLEVRKVRENEVFLLNTSIKPYPLSAEDLERIVSLNRCEKHSHDFYVCEG